MAAYKTKLGKPDSKGNYKRDLGKKVNGKPHRFYLGKDPDQAEERQGRLESLWASIEAQAESPEAAFWTDATIQIGMAIGRGENSVRLAPPLPLTGDEDLRAYVHYVDLIARRFPLISTLPADVDGYRRGQEVILESSERLFNSAKKHLASRIFWRWKRPCSTMRWMPIPTASRPSMLTQKHECQPATATIRSSRLRCSKNATRTSL